MFIVEDRELNFMAIPYMSEPRQKDYFPPPLTPLTNSFINAKSQNLMCVCPCIVAYA